MARSEFKGASHAPLLSAIFGMTAGNDFALLPSDLTVFHYAGGEVQQDKLAGRFLPAVPSEDALYFVVADQSKQRQVWTWQESHLVAVTDSAAKKLLKAAEGQTDSEEDEEAPRLPQGWHRLSLYAGRNGVRSIEVPLQTAKATIKIEQPKIDAHAHTLPRAIVTLEASTLDAPVQISSGEFNGIKDITAAEFAAYRGQDPSPRVRRSPAHAALTLSDSSFLW
ncbi:MAG TPA: hypothetical protein VIX37_04835 [Candidatus Sulfotelmatobacter sp.]